jgi:tRNA threonylcarbamoyladenosine biosynthesis protein TsaB
MVVLAIETATSEGSVALVQNGVVLASGHGAGDRPHAPRLPGDALALLGAHGLTLAEVDLFAVCLGPGAFTGLRVGIAAAQGLAFGMRRPIAGISALDALAAAALADADTGDVAGVWMDAARQEVFAARYVADPREVFGVRVLTAAVSAPPDDVVAEWADPTAVSIWIGDGAIRYRDRLPPGARLVDPTPRIAPWVARLGEQAGAAGHATTPHALRPIYVRASDAEIARDRRAAIEG